jgi:hypothetical protein
MEDLDPLSKIPIDDRNDLREKGVWRDCCCRLGAIFSGQSLGALEHKLLHTMSASKLFQVSLGRSTGSAHRKATSVCHRQAAHLYFCRNIQWIDRERWNILPIENNAIADCLRVPLNPGEGDLKP